MRNDSTRRTWQLIGATTMLSVGITLASGWALRAGAVDNRVGDAQFDRVQRACPPAVFRGTPLLLQLFLIYFGLPQIGIYLSPMVSGVLGLGIHYAVYNADVMRTGIVAIESGQYEASRSLGLSRAQTLRKVIIPQALRNVAPALGNNLIALLKESSLVSIITVPELTLAAQRAISDTFRPFEFYIAAGAIYYGVNYFLEMGLKRVEMKTALAR